MDLSERAFRGGAWYGGLRSAAQLASWAVTVLVARQLSPSAYGLMEAATILTGVVEVFSELGLGASLVQRRRLEADTISGLFWVSVMAGAVLTLVGFVLAYPTAWLLAEPALVGVTQYASLSFAIGGVSVVPMNLLTREGRFKAIGIVQLCAALCGSATTLWLAYAGAGVWALASGMLVVRATTAIGAFVASRWRPSAVLDLRGVRPHLGFGLQVTLSRLLYYALQKSDRAVVSRVLGMEALGYYVFARSLASLPNDKIVALVNQVLFPVLAGLQANPEALKRTYGHTVRYIALITFLPFLLGAAFGDSLVAALLGPRWQPLEFLFRMFCVAQMVVAVTSLNTTVVNAVGRPGLVAGVGVLNLGIMVLAILLAAHGGLNYLVLPWLLVYPAMGVGLAAVTMRLIRVEFGTVARSLVSPACGAVASVAAGLAAELALTRLTGLPDRAGVVVLGSLGVASLAYVAYLWGVEAAAVRALIGRFASTGQAPVDGRGPLAAAAERM